MSIAAECDKTLDGLVALRHALMNLLPIGEGNASSYFADYFGSMERFVLQTMVDSGTADA